MLTGLRQGGVCAYGITMIDVVNEIPRMEDQIKGAGYSLFTACKDMGITRSTWQRWKAGEVSPSLANWNKVLKYMEGINA